MGAAANPGNLTHADVVAQRAAVVAAARSWLRTPFHHGQRCKGAGVDCVNLVCAAYEESGVGAMDGLPHYAPDWMLHSNDTRFIDGLLLYCDEVPPPPDRMPLPGDVVAWMVGRSFSHGAIVIAWPSIIHAFGMDPVSEADADSDVRLKFIGEYTPELNLVRPRRFFVPRAWRPAEN